MDNSFKARINSNQIKLSDTIKLLIYKTDKNLFDLVDFKNNDTFLEPFVFMFFNNKNRSIKLLEEILQGYFKINKLTIEHSFNKKGIAYIPNLGYFHKDNLQKKHPLEKIESTKIEIIKHSHPLLDFIFEIASNKKIRSSKFYLDLDMYEKNKSFLKRAFTIIKNTSKEHFNLIEATCKKCIMFNTNTKNTNSFATINAHGVAFFNVYQKDYDEVFFIDDIAHQTGHIILTSFFFKRNEIFLIDENINIGTITKNKNEFRSFYILLHALYTYYSSLLCLDNAINSKYLNKRQNHEARGRIGFYINKLRLDIANFKKVVKYNKGIKNIFTDEGVKIFYSINKKTSKLVTKWYPITKNYIYQNQPYNFTYQEFVKLNILKDD